MEESEYQFETSLESGSGSEAEKFRSIAASALATQLRHVFNVFPKALVEKHGKDLLVEADETPSGSGASTPSGTAPANAGPVPIQPVKTSSPNGTRSINTTKVSLEAELRVSADDLFDLLTDGDNKVPMWTRAPAKIRPEKGAEVSLFGGNISGQIKDVQRPGKVVMSWRAPTWPTGHFGQLTMQLSERSEATDLVLQLEGVPLGSEEETERNLDIYYIRSLKQIGLGTIL